MYYNDQFAKSWTLLIQSNFPDPKVRCDHFSKSKATFAMDAVGNFWYLSLVVSAIKLEKFGSWPIRQIEDNSSFWFFARFYLKFGAPPHGGSAPGIDRIIM